MKKLLLLLLLSLHPIFGRSQMCNTTSTNMGALTMTTAFQNVSNASGARRFWTFNATAGCTYDFSTCSSAFTNDTYLRLYRGTVPTTAILQVQNDDNGPFCLGNKASLTWTCVTTGTYSILVTNYVCANLSATTILSYRETCAPPFNPCTTITNIASCGVSTTATITSGTGVYNPPTTSCGFTTPGREIIYTFTPTVSGIYTISQTSSYGFIDYFFKPTSTGCSGTGWTCIDDLSGLVTSASFTLTAGVTYYIMLDPEVTGGGNVTFTINCPTLPVANDNCSNAINISLPYTSPVSTNNPSSDDVPTSTSSCGTQGSNVWYKVTGNGNQYFATTCNPSTNFDTEIRVYTGTCPSLSSMVEIVCNDDDGTCGSSGLNSSVNWCSNPGVDYYISVGYFISGTGYGNFVLNVTQGTPCSSLPVELLEFSGTNKKEYNNLIWVTATETNNDYFTLERSIDGIEWSHVTTVNGGGTSSTPHLYEHRDYSYTKDVVNYYRLSQTDYNGMREYFNIIPIDSQTNNSNCEQYEYYNLTGAKVDFESVSAGIYIRKCGDTVIKIIKINQN